jgi:glycosyltransferase involved in cell wall biosynthesis
MHGMGVEFLKDLLTSIKKQSYANIEIVISDHSKNDEIELFVISAFKEFVKRNTQILYYRFNEKHGNSSANMNNAIIHASGQIIKPMFQDDFFCNNECINEIVTVMKNYPEVLWGAIGFIHTDEKITHYYNDLIPYYNKQILTGNNTMGCPTVCFFRKTDVSFDEKLIWLMDCEFYHVLRKHGGNPIIIHKTGVAIRVWTQSVSYEVPDEVKISEGKYVLEKHNETRESLENMPNE